MHAAIARCKTLCTDSNPAKNAIHSDHYDPLAAWLDSEFSPPPEIAFICMGLAINNPHNIARALRGL